jgi:hypothetical protein
LFDDFKPGAHLVGWGVPGPDCLTDFSVIAWIDASSRERQF